MRTDILLELLQAGMWNREPDCSLFPISDEDWKQIYFSVHKQAVEGIVYDAVCQLPEEALPPMDILANWVQDVQQIEQRYHQHVKLVGWLTARMQGETGLSPIVLKGIGLADCYPNPHHRTVGDIDLFYGDTEKCEQANQAIERWGTPVQRGKNSESILMLNQVVVEQHGHLLLTNHLLHKKALYEWLDNQMQKADSTRGLSTGGTTITLLNPTLDLLQLCMHSLKHLLNEGIGLKQLSDIAVFLEKNQQNIDEKELSSALETFGIKRWATLIFSFCVRYLGLKAECLPQSFRVNYKKTEKLLAEIQKSGNFGMLDERNQLRPDSEMGGKIFTARRMIRNSSTFFLYAPYEALGLPGNLIVERLKEIF